MTVDPRPFSAAEGWSSSFHATADLCLTASPGARPIHSSTTIKSGTAVVVIGCTQTTFGHSNGRITTMHVHFIPVLWVEQAALNFELRVLSFVTELDTLPSRALQRDANPIAA